MNTQSTQDLENIKKANQQSAQNANPNMGNYDSMNSNDLQQARQANQQSASSMTLNMSSGAADASLEETRKRNQESANRAQQNNSMK